MGLKVWLPLTKDLHNQGTSQVTMTNNGATYSSTGGKLGGCYNFDGVDDRIWASDLNISGDTISVCCWFKRDSSYTNEGYIMSLNNGSGYADCEIGIDSDSGNIIGVAGGIDCHYSCTHGIWHHIAVTYDKQNIRTYLDGILLEARANTQSLTKPYFTIGARANGGNAENGIAYPFKGQINDVRLYNYCLSPKEVKEISNGLVLHYPLERRGLGNKNLMKNSHAGWTSTGYNILYGDLSEDWIVGQEYTITIKGSPSNNCQFGLWRDDGWASCGLLDLKTGFTNIWTRTFTCPSVSSNSSASLTRFSIYDYPSGNPHSSYIEWIKIEKGDKSTPWCPATTDSLYSTLDLNSNIEYDGSGFQNNGIRTGTFTWSNDIPPGGLYPVSTHFSGSNFIACGKGGKVTDAITIAVWARMDNWANYAGRLFSCTQEGGWTIKPNDGSFQIFMGTGTSSNTYKNLNFTTAYSSGLAAGWHHFVITYDGLTLKAYLDGQPNGSLSCYSTKTPIFYYANNGIFLAAEALEDTTTSSNERFTGDMSDFRIYATALSASDILSLYQNGAKVDTSTNPATIWGKIR